MYLDGEGSMRNMNMKKNNSRTYLIWHTTKWEKYHNGQTFGNQKEKFEQRIQGGVA